MFKRIILAGIVGIALSCAALEASPPYRQRAKPQYKNSYRSTCAIVSDTVFGRRCFGTGVLLESGVVITNRHVVDTNGNNKIDPHEEKIGLLFINGRRKAKVYSGKIVLAGGAKYDLAFIKLKNAPKSKVRLATNAQYKRVKIGDEVYAFGFWLGRLPAHMTTGVISSSMSPDYGRTSTQYYYGGSGGGLFLKDSGVLIGINTRIRAFRGHVVPGWSEYIRATTVRRFLAEKKKLCLLRKYY